MRTRSLLAALLLCLLASCSSNEPESILDVAVRLPDLEGVVTDINNDSMKLDGKSYEIDPAVESISTFKDHRVIPLVQWQGRYVHAGLADDKVIWIAGIGIVAPRDGTVIYTGKFLRMEEGRAIFEDGTALVLGKGVKPPKKGLTAVAVIDSKTDRVTELESKEVPSSKRSVTPGG